MDTLLSVCSHKPGEKQSARNICANLLESASKHRQELWLHIGCRSSSGPRQVRAGRIVSHVLLRVRLKTRLNKFETYTTHKSTKIGSNIGRTWYIYLYISLVKYKSDISKKPSRFLITTNIIECFDMIKA